MTLGLGMIRLILGLGAMGCAPRNGNMRRLYGELQDTLFIRV